MTGCTCTPHLTRIPGEPHIPLMVDWEPNPTCPEHFPDAVVICGAEYRAYGEQNVCRRPKLHGGQHAEVATEPNEYGHIMVRTWSSDLSVGWAETPGEVRYCPRCSTPFFNASPHGVCTGCLTDASWLRGYQEGRVFVANGRAYKRENYGGAFGNRPLTVTLADGTVYGPDSKTWDLGTVSAAVRPEMPDNATLDWGRS